MTHLVCPVCLSNCLRCDSCGGMISFHRPHTLSTRGVFCAVCMEESDTPPKFSVEVLTEDPESVDDNTPLDMDQMFEEAARQNAYRKAMYARIDELVQETGSQNALDLVNKLAEVMPQNSPPTAGFPSNTVADSSDTVADTTTKTMEPPVVRKTKVLVEENGEIREVEFAAPGFVKDHGTTEEMHDAYSKKLGDY